MIDSPSAGARRELRSGTGRYLELKRFFGDTRNDDDLLRDSCVSCAVIFRISKTSLNERWIHSIGILLGSLLVKSVYS